MKWNWKCKLQCKLISEQIKLPLQHTWPMDLSWLEVRWWSRFGLSMRQSCGQEHVAVLLPFALEVKSSTGLRWPRTLQKDSPDLDWALHCAKGAQESHCRKRDTCTKSVSLSQTLYPFKFKTLSKRQMKTNYNGLRYLKVNLSNELTHPSNSWMLGTDDPEAWDWGSSSVSSSVDSTSVLSLPSSTSGTARWLCRLMCKVFKERNDNERI